MPQSRPLRGLVAVLALLVAFAGGTVVIDDGPPRSITITETVPAAPPATAVDGPDADSKRDDALPLNDAAQDVLENATRTPERFDMAGDLRGVDPEPAGVLDGPLAAQEWPGCKTAFVNSFSSRGGKRPELIWLHYTAGLNRPGWADLDGLTAYSNNVANQVSWNFGIDREGHCSYNVPVNHKSWAAANANRTAINIEVVGTGKEPDYAGTAGMRKVGQVVRRITRIYPNIKIRLGAVSACSPTRSGIVTHWMGGHCSGGHIDIKPYDLPKVIAQIASGGVTATDRTTCRKLNWWRRHGRPGGKARARAIRRRKALARRHVTCTSKGPRRTA